MFRTLRRRRVGGRILPAIKLLVGILLIALAAGAMISFNRNIEKKETASVKAAVQKAVTECYSLEGSYPPNLKYLQKNYGLILDTKRYVYDYTVYASNLPPDIFIFKKNS